MGPPTRRLPVNSISSHVTPAFRKHTWVTKKLAASKNHETVDGLTD